MIYTEEEVVLLMNKAFDVGFKQYDVVEAGLECKERDEFVRWILLGFKKKKSDVENNKL